MPHGARRKNGKREAKRRPPPSLSRRGPRPRSST